MKQLAPNTKLQDRYKITEIIGKGGMGEVYLAIDQRLGHSIALKRTTVGGDQILTEAFEREAKTLAQLRHSMLPKVSDHFIENGEQYLVMEYISGEDLSERLKATGKAFPLNWVMFWADQILDALHYLHTYDPPIIHRDIKPQNLKLTSENQIVLLDFGLSKNALGKTQVTSSGSVLGYSPHYASMEQIRGTGTNAKSDLFSLSATLYHLLTNETPIDALTRAEAVLSGKPDPLKPLTQLNPEINETLSNHILKGMEITHDKRFVSARDMQKALRRAFNEMQNSMSAQTVEFNSNALGIEGSEIGEKTEVFNDLQSPTEVAPVPISDEFVSELTEDDSNLPQTLVGGYRPNDISAEKTEVINAEEFKAAVGDRDLNATVEYNSEIADVLEKNDTEPEDNSAQAFSESNQNNTQDISVDESDFKTQDDFSPESFKTAENVEISGNAEQNATVPFTSLKDIETSEENSEVADTISDVNWDESFVAEKPYEKAVDEDIKSVAAVGLTDNFSNINADEDSEESSVELEQDNEKTDSIIPEKQPTANSIPAKNKSSAGKYVAMLGGLGVVLFLLIGTALGLGYYYTNGGFNFSDDGTTTETQPTPEVKTEKPETEITPEIAETDSTNSTETQTETDSENESENTSEEGLEDNETIAKEDGSTDTEKQTDTNSTVTKSTKTVTKKSTKTAIPKSQTTAKRTSTKSRTRSTNRTNGSTKKTKKPPTKKKTKKVKDAGVL